MSVSKRSIFVGVFCIVVGVVIGVVIRHMTSSKKEENIVPLGFLENLIKDDDATIQPKLLKEVNPRNIRDYLRKLSAKPHLGGTPADKRQAQELANFWKSLGLRTKLKSYNVLLSYPNKDTPNRIELQDGDDNVLFTSQLHEKILRPDQNQSDVVPPYNAFSAQGTPVGKIVYVNYARIEDFMWITGEKMIDVEGHICIARYGKIFRGDKAIISQRFGCIGLILYTDPANYNPFGHGNVYPNSWWMPGTGVQRGNVKVSSSGIGDPLTPGYPALDSAYRIPENETILPKIPVHPIGYDDALQLLRNMSGEEVPIKWRGSLNITYRFGPGFQDPNWKVQMFISTHNEMRTTYNVFGIIPGAIEPDRYVLLGNHRDAWVFGAVDPSSGTASMMEVSRVMANAHKQGWQPRRTIVFCSWGSEEHGIIGSREWVEDYRHMLACRAVAYINVDYAVIGNYRFRGSSLPLVFNLMYDVARVVPNPDDYGRSSLYEAWRRRYPELDKMGKPTGRPYIPTLGSGSDFAPFVGKAGVTAIDLHYSYDPSIGLSSYPLYHTVYESFHLIDNYIDPGFKYHRAITQFWVELARRLADAYILPLKVTDYSNALNSYVEQIKSLYGDLMVANGLGKQIDYLTEAVTKMEVSALAFEKRLNKADKSNPIEIRMLNDQMMQLERAFIDPVGLPDRPHTKNVVFAPSVHNSYKGVKFPGILDTLFNITAAGASEKTERWRQVEKQLSIVTYFIHSSQAILNQYQDF